MIIDEFKMTYMHLSKDNLYLLDKIYSLEATFIDPFNQIKMLSNIKVYFAALYENVEKISFEFVDSNTLDGSHYITWNMHLTHPKINAGKEYCVPGISHLKTDAQQKITYHRDYFDAGIMLYEKLPVLGNIIRWIKRKL